MGDRQYQYSVRVRVRTRYGTIRYAFLSWHCIDRLIDSIRSFSVGDAPYSTKSKNFLITLTAAVICRKYNASVKRYNAPIIILRARTGIMFRLTFFMLLRRIIIWTLQPFVYHSFRARTQYSTRSGPYSVERISARRSTKSNRVRTGMNRVFPLSIL